MLPCAMFSLQTVVIPLYFPYLRGASGGVGGGGLTLEQGATGADPHSVPAQKWVQCVSCQKWRKVSLLGVCGTMQGAHRSYLQFPMCNCVFLFVVRCRTTFATTS